MSHLSRTNWALKQSALGHWCALSLSPSFFSPHMEMNYRHPDYCREYGLLSDTLIAHLSGVMVSPVCLCHSKKGCKGNPQLQLCSE